MGSPVQVTFQNQIVKMASYVKTVSDDLWLREPYL